MIHFRFYSKIGALEQDFAVNDYTDLRVSVQIEIWQDGDLMANVGSEIFWDDDSSGEIILIPFNDPGFEDFAFYATDDVNDCIVIRTAFGSGGEEDTGTFTERTWWLKELSLENDLVGFTLDYIKLTMTGVSSEGIEIEQSIDQNTGEELLSPTFHSKWEFFGRED